MPAAGLSVQVLSEDLGHALVGIRWISTLTLSDQLPRFRVLMRHNAPNGHKSDYVRKFLMRHNAPTGVMVGVNEFDLVGVGKVSRDSLQPPSRAANMLHDRIYGGLVVDATAKPTRNRAGRWPGRVNQAYWEVSEPVGKESGPGVLPR